MKRRGCKFGDGKTRGCPLSKKGGCSFAVGTQAQRVSAPPGGNIGDLFVKCMRQVTKGHLYHLLGISDYYVMYRQKAKSVL